MSLFRRRLISSYKKQEEPIVDATIYTIVIDKVNRTYNSRCVYADDCVDFLASDVDNDTNEFYGNVWLERFPFNQIKPCVMKDGKVIGYLNPNDYSKYEDGSLVEDDFIDIMVEIPKIYYVIENIDPYIYIHISNKKIDNRYKCYAHVYDGKEVDKIYIAAYHAAIKNYNGVDTLYSYSNSTPFITDIINNETYSSYLSSKSSGYRFLNFDQIVLLQCLFVLMFRSTGSQFTFSRGYMPQRNGVLQNNGILDTGGMYNADDTSYEVPCKLFGIENIYGNVYTWVEGVSIDTMPDSSEYVLKRRDPYSSVAINKYGNGYDEYKNPSLNGVQNERFWLDDPYGTTELGFLPYSTDYAGSTYGGSSSRYYTDSSFI